MKRIKYLLVGLLVLNLSFGQDDSAVLMTVDNEPILASEFMRVYNKNLDLVQDESQKDIDGYLQLFTEYQLKLKEAKRLKLDKESKYLREFGRYKKQLTKNYLTESKVTEALVNEAYERSNIDIKASHVLIRLDQREKDTLEAYKLVLKLRQRVLDDGFDKVKEEMHDGKTVFLEDLGYFSAFKMVYDFENAAYNTPVGEISMPFRTQFGYHVVIVNDKRKSRGTITAAHIMIAMKQKDTTLIPEKRIKEIYAKLNQGETFESLAKQFSDDKSSARNGGKLAPFKSGQLSSVEFEDKAFSLGEDGEVSAPFKTAYGWHIVKRIKLEPNKPFKEVKPMLENRVKRDSRSKLINTAMVEELKKRYKIIYTAEAQEEFERLIDNSFFTGQWQVPKTLDQDKMIFKINNEVFNYGEFANHLRTAQRVYTNRKMQPSEVINKEFEAFFEKSIFQFREDNLELENEDFANILKEYRDGLLLFDLMEKEIWNKAAKDSVGLVNYYSENSEKYKWNQRIDAVILSSADKAFAKKAQTMLKAEKSQEDISNELNLNNIQNIIFTNGIFPVDSDKLPSGFDVKEGVSKVYKHNESYHVINVKSVLPEGEKTFDEARGSVINDYQNKLEKDWLSSLQSRYVVKVNEEVLRDLKKEIKN